MASGAINWLLNVVVLMDITVSHALAHTLQHHVRNFTASVTFNGPFNPSCRLRPLKSPTAFCEFLNGPSSTRFTLQV
jgi:hypothetical protein